MSTAKVPDARLAVLAAIYKPKKVTAAEITFVEPAGNIGSARGQLWSPAEQAQLGKADALVHVVRYFADEQLPHPSGSVDPERDIADLHLELALSDLGFLERRRERIQAGLKGARASEADAARAELRFLERVCHDLEREVPVRQQELSPAEREHLGQYPLLTAKPELLVANLGEEQVAGAPGSAEELARRHGGERCAVSWLCGKLEMELSRLGPEEAGEFRGELGLGEGAMAQVVRLGYALVGLISFLTVGPDEVRAWSIATSTTAWKAAGKIHSDIERGFIRAEVIVWDRLVECGSEAEARKRGWLRVEGKDYLVQDGDVINFLFNV